MPLIGKPLPDPESLGEALAYYDDYLAFLQRMEGVAGVQAAVLVENAIVLSTAHGHADLETDVQLNEDHLLRVGSITKTLNAMAVMRLVEDTVLRLDDPASHWIAYLDGTPVGDVTIRELLSHTGGLTVNGAEGDFFQLDVPFPNEGELRSILLSETAAVLPRQSTWKYSNVGTSLAGLVAATAAGTSYGELIRREVIERLGLTSTVADFEPARLAELATSYLSHPLTNHPVPVEHVPLRSFAPAGGCYSTARDVATLFSALFVGDERLLRDEAKREMEYSSREIEGGGSYGLGLMCLKESGRHLIGHGGGIAGFRAFALADAHAKLAITVLTTSPTSVTHLATALLKLIDLAGSQPRPSVRVDMDRFKGRFVNHNSVVDVTVLGGRLYALAPTFARASGSGADPTMGAHALEIVDDKTLRVLSGPYIGELMQFIIANNGHVEYVRGSGAATTFVPINEFVLPDRLTPRTTPGHGLDRGRLASPRRDP